MTDEVAIEPARDDDLVDLHQLLDEQELPRDGLQAHLHTTLVARRHGRIIGSAGLERYTDGALLRSVAVAASARGRGLGQALVAAALALAGRSQVSAVYLLTTTAAPYFSRFGFETIPRNEVPIDVRQSVEFTAACPSSATVMRKRL